MFTNIRLGLVMTLVLAGCGAGPNNFGDAGDPPDGDLGGDAADDHKVGFKPDTGSDADTSDASDAGPTGDANPQDSGGTTGPRRVFMTVDEYAIGTGALHFNSLAAADAVCQAHATKAALSGTWKAWLSSSASSASARFNHGGGPFKLVDGTIVANDWTELTSGTLQHKINEDEVGQTWSSAVIWTSTNTNGAALSSTCADWSSASTATAVNYGTPDFADSRWTNDAMTTCGDHMGFFCFEQ